MVMRGASTFESYPARIVVRTPSEPDFWCGNLVIFRHCDGTPQDQIDRFHADFPDARHVTLAWDTLALPSEARLAQFEAMGLEIDRCDVLALSGPLARTVCPPGIEIRSLSGDDDWAQAIALQVETGVSLGFERESYGSYVSGRFATRRRQVADGWGCWFGAFDGPLLVGDLGILVGDGLARFQDVETRQSHRRRGICAALVCAGLDWAATQDPSALPVILSDRDGPAGRIYRRCGFAVAEVQVMAIRSPPGAKTTG